MSEVIHHIESIQIHRVCISDGLWGASNLFAKSLYPAGVQFHEYSDQKRALCGWVMIQNANIIGRMAAYLGQPYNEEALLQLPKDELLIKGKKAFSGKVFLGNYECINNPVASERLFEHVFNDLKHLEFNQAIGPMTGNTWNDYRFKTSGEDLFLGESQQLEYYVNQWLKSGFRAIQNYHSTQITALDVVNEKIQVLARRLMAEGVVFRNVRMNQWEEELKRIYDLSLVSFAGNVLYEPIEWQEFRDKYLPLQRIADPQWIELAENNQGALIGFAFAIPNLMDPSNHGLVLKTVARSNHKSYRGLGLILAQQLHLKAHQAGKKYVIHAYMHSGNASLACSNTLHGKINATYQLFEKTLDTA